MIKFFRENKYIIWFISAFLMAQISVIILIACVIGENSTISMAVIGAFWILILIGMFFLWKKLRSKEATREKARYVLSAGIFLLLSLVTVFTIMMSDGV